MLGYFIYLVLKGFSFLINLLPEGVALWVGRQMGNIAYYLDWEHRHVAFQNLRLAFGQEKTEEERRSIAKRSFQHMGMMVIEFFRILKMDTKSFERKVSVEGLEEALKLLERKRGGLLLVGHFGNWELMGVMSKVLQIPILAIAKPIKENEKLYRFILEIRNKAGLRIISPENATQRVLQALSKNWLVAVLIDQRAKRSRAVWVDFFGKKAPTMPGLAVMAIRSRAPVVPVFMIRDGFQKHRLVVKEPLELVLTGDMEKDVETNMQRFTNVLESMVRAYPDQWIWIHRRWERRREDR
ncbi:MAG: lysophospholipid acyltransferase family protein [Thermodesulfobacteriota bacterium]